MKRYLYHIIVITAAFLWPHSALCEVDHDGGTMSGTFTLTDNTRLINRIVVSGTLIIDLNGYVLYPAGGAEEVINVPGGTNLIIKDSNPGVGHSGYIDDNGLFRWPRPNDKQQFSIPGGIIYNPYTNESTNRKGISVSGTCRIEGGTIAGCFDPRIGAAVTCSSSGTLTMTGGKIMYNRCKVSEGGSAGAIYGEVPNKNNGSSINLSNVTLSHNKTQGKGGAICGYQVTLNNCTFEGNSATLGGGAIFVRSQSGDLSINGCTIKHNAATGEGGALYVADSAPCTIVNSEISYNSSVVSGGGINASGTLDINNSTISFNSGVNGGGIRVSGVCTIDNTIIEHNYATTGGGGIYASGATTITDSYIRDNRAMATETANEPDEDGLVNKGRGGGFLFAGDNKINDEDDAVQFILDNTMVTGNAAMYYGGGGQLQDKGKLTLQNQSQINSNTSVLKGAAGLHLTGGVYFYMTSTTQISNNTALGGVGGGIHSSYECSIHLDGGEISGNKVYGRGGGVHVNTGGNLVLKNIDITGNFAYDGIELLTSEVIKGSDGKYSWTKPVGNPNDKYPGYGGGLLINSGSCTMNEGNISNNYAQTLGGGIGLIMTESSNYAHYVRLAEFVLNSGTVSNNTTDGDGAGVYLMRNILSGLTEEEKKKYTQLTDDWTPKIKLNGGTISNNKAKDLGGGAYQEQGTEFIVPAGKTTLLEGNEAKSGGAVYIDAGDFKVEGTAKIFQNTATNGDGGAVYLGNGNFTVSNNGTLILGSSGAGNIAQQGNGGGIYCKGAFTVNGTTDISYNTAINGGGVCVENGSVTLVDGKNSEVTYNEATNMGGGLYVINKDINYQTASFQGGKFIDNKAKAGGAVCAEGKITLTLSANMESNKAKVGGGIYMADGVNMTFGNGLIRANVAEKDNEIYTTAYQKAASNVSGVGGGIFIANNSTLNFANNITEMGIYNNGADNAGADICANGNNTTITLPAVTGMELRGFDVPGNELYWVYDYFNGDTQSSQSSNGYLYKDLPAMRYEQLLLLSPTEDGERILAYIGNKEEQRTYDKYVCLDLGYDLVFVDFTTTGLKPTDNAAILMKYTKADETIVQYRKVLFHGSQAKTIALPSGEWMFESSTWSAGYKDPTFSGVQVTATGFKINSMNKNIVATFVPKSDSSAKAKVYEHYKVNRMRLE